MVSDFRTRDMAAGGKGAPLVPFVDYSSIRASEARACGSLNIGGIANVTAIPPAGNPEEVIAFDTGPGNMVVDQLVAIHTSDRQKFDVGGAIAAKGKLNQKLLDSLLRASYFRRTPPKTAGREQYGTRVRRRVWYRPSEPMLDLIATADCANCRLHRDLESQAIRQTRRR